MICPQNKLNSGLEITDDFKPLEFPKVINPEVSIVIPAYNKFPVTYNCLSVLLAAYNHTSFEVIVVDDGSDDNTLNLLKLAKGIKYLRNETAKGFVFSCNAGAKVASGPYLAMLNNDTEPTFRWLDELIFLFKEFDNVGLAGSKLLYPDGKLQEAGGIVWNNGNPWNYGRNANPNDPRYNYTRQVDYLSAASVMLPKKVWDEVGGFSDEFSPAYFEDADLAFKIRKAGYKTVYAPFSVVRHCEGTSSGVSIDSGMKRYQEINRPIFKQKWFSAYKLNGEEGQGEDFNKDRGIKHRALVINYQILEPDIDAGSYATFQEIRLLQSLGFKVTFASESLAYMGHYTESLQRIGVEVVYGPFVSTLHELFKTRGKEFDLVYIVRYHIVKDYVKLIRRFCPKAKILFCNCDLHFLRLIRAAIESNDKKALRLACQVRKEELSMMQRTDVVLSYNTVEHAVILSHNLDSTKVVTCPWVVDVKEKIPGFTERSDIAFLGGFNHAPNKPAVLFFIDKVMPLLRKQLPQVKFRVYGSKLPVEIKKMADEDIIMEGYAEDLASVYNNCRVFVVPLFSGAGIKGKLIDALAHGVPSVVTPIAMEGTSLRNDLEVLIAESPEEWADAVVKLYKKQDLWEKVSKAALDYARKYHSFENGQKLISKALKAAGIIIKDDSRGLVFKKARQVAIK